MQERETALDRDGEGSGEESCNGLDFVLTSLLKSGNINDDDTTTSNWRCRWGGQEAREWHRERGEQSRQIPRWIMMIDTDGCDIILFVSPQRDDTAVSS